MNVEVKSIENQAHQLLEELKYREASQMFTYAAKAYQKVKNHHASALCYASAAGCWNTQPGEQPIYYAAEYYKKAAQQAQLSGDWEYTGILYKHAAICYEREHDYIDFSQCYFYSKEFYRKYLITNLFKLKKISVIFNRLLSWTALTFSSYLWGHGERPYRSIPFTAICILLCAFLYTQGELLKNGDVIIPSFFEAVYFSVITFITLGYGDMVPVGFNRFIAIVESFGGLFIVPIFITGLCRKYLRF